MKRIGNLFNRIISYENLVRAEKKARLGKTKRYGVKKFDRNPYENLVRLQKALIEDTYRTSEYCVYTIIADRGNKEREIYRLPYYPDRIVHHAIMNVIEPYLVSRFTADTFNCLKGRGIHYGVNGNCHNLWYRFTRSYNFKDYRQKLLSSYGIKESTR